MHTMRSRSVARAVIVIAAVTISAAAAHAQPAANAASQKLTLRVADVAMLALDSAGQLDLVVDQSDPSSRGAAATSVLHYTTINSLGTSRSITVQSDPRDAPPSGTSLRVRASSVPAGCGVPSREITIDARPQRLVSDIPSCATGARQGAVIEYRLVLDDQSRAAGGERSTVTVVFTLSEM